MVRPQKIRRALLVTSLGFNMFMEGFTFGQGMSMIVGLYQEKEELNLSNDDISWIISLLYLPMIFGTLVATIFTERFGRRLVMTVFSIPIIMYLVIIYFAQDKYLLMLCRLLVGFYIGGTLPATYLSASEYSSPKLRGLYLAFISAVSLLGAAVGEITGLAIHWRKAGLYAVIPAAVGAILPVFFVESPQWLASKGKFEECKAAYRALHGDEVSAERELQLLIQVEKTKHDKGKSNTHVIKSLLDTLKIALTKRYFWKIIGIDSVMNIYKLFCGKVFKGMLGATIIQYVTGQTDVLVNTITVNVCMLSGSCLSNILIAKTKNRVLLFSSSILNISVVIVLIVFMYMKSRYGMVYPWVSTIILALHYMVLNGSVYPLTQTIPPELYPLELKGIFVSYNTLFSTLTMFIIGKFLPSIIVLIGYHGMYMSSIAVMCVCLTYLWFNLLETKGKTLQEIELNLKNDKAVNIDEVLKGDQIKELI